MKHDITVVNRKMQVNQENVVCEDVTTGCKTPDFLNGVWFTRLSTRLLQQQQR